MRRVAVIGVGHSKFGRRQDVSVSELAFEAVKPALEDAGIAPKDIELVAVGSAGGWYEEALPAVATADYCGLSGKGLVRVEAACATGSAAAFSAYAAVASGLADVALALGVEKMCEVDTLTAVELIGRAGSYTWEFENFGLTFPGYYAMYATAHMEEYGTTEEDLALVAVKNHHYASMNPLAHLQRKATVEEVLASEVIAWPLKLFDCCPISDGAAAAVLASEEKVKELRVDTPVWIAAVGLSSDTCNLTKRPDYVGLRAAVWASRKAYDIAKMGPEDVDCATVHDCFTIAEIMAYEDLGFCRKGEGPKLIREGQTYIGGKIPINVDGGLKGKGHPIGATGVSMIAELTRQLREEIKPRERQVPMKKYVALAHNVGGTGHYCYVTILKR